MLTWGNTAQPGCARHPDANRGPAESYRHSGRKTHTGAVESRKALVLLGLPSAGRVRSPVAPTLMRN